jgi:autotransporter-associated beta strand protein
MRSSSAHASMRTNAGLPFCKVAHSVLLTPVLRAVAARPSVGRVFHWRRFRFSKGDTWIGLKTVAVLFFAAISGWANQTWLGAADNQWTNLSNWSGHALPTSTDQVLFNSAAVGNFSNWLATPFSVAGLVQSNQVQKVPIITLAGSSLTIGTQGIDISKTSDIGLTNNEPVVLNGSQTWNSGMSTIVLNNVVSGTGNLTLIGRIMLGASNNFDGTLQLSPATLSAKNPNALGTNLLSIGYPSTLSFLSGAETSPIYTPLTLAGGSLKVGDHIGVTINSDIRCTASPTSINSDSNAFYTINGNISATNGTLTFGLLGRVTNTIFGTVSLGSGNLYKDNSGSNSTLRLLNANNSWSGGTLIAGGTLQIGNGAEDAALPGNVSLFGGQLAFLTATNSSYIYPGAITGTGSLLKDGLGTLYLTGPNSFGGSITNNAGALWLDASGGLYQGIVCITNNLLHAGIHLNGTNGNITFPSGVNWYVNQGEGAIVNEAGDNVINGFMILGPSGADAYLKVNSGTLTLNGQLTAGPTSTTIRLGGSGNGTNNGSIASSFVQVLKQDSGCWTFTGISSTGGSNAVVGGTLVVNGQLPISSKLNVFATGTLSGYGIIKGPTAIMGGGTLALGTNIGMMSISNSLTLNGTNIMKVTRSGSISTNDLICGITTIAFGGTLSVVGSGSGWSAGDSFRLYDAKTYTGAFAKINLPGLPGNLVWELSGLAAGGDGRLRITTAPPPTFNSVTLLNDGNLRLVFSCPGLQSTACTVWANTNLWPGNGAWVPVGTGSISGVSAAYDDLDATNFPERFYRISIP